MQQLAGHCEGSGCEAAFGTEWLSLATLSSLPYQAPTSVFTGAQVRAHRACQIAQLQLHFRSHQGLLALPMEGCAVPVSPRPTLGLREGAELLQ